MSGRKVLFSVMLLASFLVSVFLLSFAMVRPASAQTAEQIAELQRLIALVTELQRQLAILEGQSTSLPPGACPALSSRLSFGSNSADVANLQQFLSRTGDYTLGQITSYFGSATESAVKRFQCRNNIICNGSPAETGYGAVGPATRAAILRICSTASTPIPPPLPPPNPVYCYFGSTTMTLGETRTFYRESAVIQGQSCQTTQRTCLTNGALSGDPLFSHATCSATLSPNCTVGGTTISNNASLKLYNRTTVLFGQNCEAFAQTRTCNNGALSGDNNYRFTTCAVGTAQSCELDSVTVTHGNNRMFYSTSTVPYNATCESRGQTRICNDGILSGSGSFSVATCKVTPEKKCVMDGITFNPGTYTFYTSRSVASGQSCSSIDAQRTCTNGTWSGNADYIRYRCAPVGTRWCYSSGTYVKHNDTATFYNRESVPFGQSCSAFTLSRKCTDGTLSGSTSYQYAKCEAEKPASCELDGVTVEHDGSRAFYSTQNASSGDTCAMRQQTRTCVDGILSGSSSFQYKSCTN